MIRKILLTLMVALVGLSMDAQTYKVLWKQAETAAMKDGKPRTALNIVRSIHRKAVGEGNDAELLRAAAAEVQLCDALSPDSSRRSLQSLREAAEREQRPAVRALWQSTLGVLHINSDRTDTATVNRGRRYLRASVADVDLLGAASARDYLPLFVIGKDSRHYGDDLLSVVARNFFDSGVMPADECRDLYGKLIAFYHRQGHTAGELFMTLDSIDRDGGSYYYPSPTGFERLRDVATRFESLPENVETYIRMNRHRGRPWVTDSMIIGLLEKGLQLYGKTPQAGYLRNALQMYCQPTLQLHLPTEQGYPGEPMVVRLNAQNLDRATFRLYRTRLTTAKVLQLQAANDKRYERYVEGSPTVIKRDFARLPVWQTYEDSITLDIAKEGIYLLEARVGNEQAVRHLVHVSRVRTIGIAEADDKSRLIVVDARDGHPLAEAGIAFYREGARQKVLSPDTNGYVHLSREAFRRMEAVAISGKDVFAAPQSGYSLFGGYLNNNYEERQRTLINIFTDRAIYRPGQQVRFGGVVFRQTGDSLSVIHPFEMTATLCNTQGKEVAEMKVFADEMGHFKGDFTLPTASLPGFFSIRVKGQNQMTNYAGFRVEEYKRPTVTAELKQPTEAYMVGDTVRLDGSVRSYTDLPIAGARISWTVTRTSWYHEAYDDNPYHASGETQTDSAGYFVVPVDLKPYEHDTNDGIRPYNRYFYEVRYTVTADNGESVDGRTVIHASTRRAVLTDEWPATVCREDLPRQRYSCTGGMGQPLDRTVHYRLWRLDATSAASDSICVAEGDVVTGQTFRPENFASLPSGHYRWQAEMQDSTERLRTDKVFTLFSLTDTRPVVKTPYFQHVRIGQRKDSATVLLGTSADSTYLYYTLVAGGRILESERYCLSNQLRRFDLQYKPEYGQSARACFAIMRDGRLYKTEADVERPAPEKDLRLTWSTFRDEVTPGSAEEWRLRVTYPDGRPADAALIARMYDRSLDAFGRNDLQLAGINFYRMTSNACWFGNRMDGHVLGWAMKLRLEEKLPTWKFTEWNLPQMTYAPIYRYNEMRTPRMLHARKTSATMSAKVATPMYDLAAREEAAAEADAAMTGAGTDEGNVPDAAVRTDFAETALFTTALRTDADGQVTLAFRMPQSLTSWRLEALAHTAAMDHGHLDTVIVARRKLMVQPALPRFVRAGDKVSLPVTVSNLSGTDQQVDVTLVIRRASDGTLLLDSRQKVGVVAGGRSTVTFDCDVPADSEADGWSIRVVGNSSDYSDGEQHELPVFSHRREITRSLPFSLPGHGTNTLRLDTLWRVKGATAPSMTVEIMAHPTWYAVDALPTILQNTVPSSDSWATRLYALSVAHHIARRSPEVADAIRRAAAGDSAALPRLRTTGLDATTPWLKAADREASRRRQLIQLFDNEAFAAHRATAIDQLRALQLPEGGWAWFRGMQPNLYMTLDVATLLARVENLGHDAEVAALLQNARRYLDTTMESYVREDRRHPGTADATVIRYLYLCALTGQPENATTRYLLKRAGEWNARLSVYDKSLLTVVMERAGRHTQAERLAAGLAEFTVSSPEMGRWFDSARDRQSGTARQISTQSAAIEALTAVGSADTAAIDEMKLWLMQSRRTQMWAQPRMAADAVYALLLGNGGTGAAVQPLGDTQAVCYTLKAGSDIVDAPAASAARGVEALTRRTYDSTSHPSLFAPSSKRDVSLTVRSQTDGVSWGSVAVTYTQPATDVRFSAAGMSVQTTVEVNRPGSGWTVLTPGTRLNVGDRVRQVCRVTADRNYDFVRITLPRPACFAPARALSGYRCDGRLWFYSAVGDNRTDCYVEQLVRGDHVLTEEYHVDRAGEYHTGCAEVGSVYEPEYRGNDVDRTVRVK